MHLRVLQFRDLLIQHLLLEHESAHSPNGGLRSELRDHLRQMGSDYDVSLSDRPGQADDGSTLNLILQSREDADGSSRPRPLLALSGLFTSRAFQASDACFKAIQIRLLIAPETAPAEPADLPGPDPVQDLLACLGQPQSVSGIWQRAA